MFPEYRDLISRLKNEDRHFERLFNEHNDLDEKITELEKHISPVGEVEIETLKKQKQRLSLPLLVHQHQTKWQNKP